MLTQKRIERTKKPGRYRDRGGPVKGLLLQISANGAKSYILRYELDGRERMLGLGSAATFSLKEARERGRQARQLLADGRDPVTAKQAERAAIRAAEARKLTFRQAAERYFDQHESKWRNASHRDSFLRTLRKHAAVLADMDVAAIDTPAVLRAIDPIWKSKSVTADRVRNRIEAVIDWAVVRGHRPPGTNPARWKGHLDQVLPAAREVAPIAHHAAMPYTQIAAFMAELRTVEGCAARALEFLILTAARTGEVREAEWSEIDFEQATWTIPAGRMKAGREHRVPLSDRCIELLKALPREKGNPRIFLGHREGVALSKMALSYVMDRLDQKVTIHGMRSTFRDWAGERTSFAHDICEAALAHVRGDATVRAYARGDLLERRRQLMEQWARFCCTPPKASGGVVKLRG
jgi:integrase